MAITTEERLEILSNHYYNLGLDYAKARNLSAATENLRRSLEIDKRNTDARNLLGLVYYECGEIVQAISAWVVSKHFQPDENPAEEYLNEIQGNTSLLDTMDQAVSKYNRALSDAWEGKDDLAIIQLKKVVSVYPKFIRAMELLALLQMMNNEPDRAMKLVNRILAIDCGNARALRYQKEIRQSSEEGQALNENAKDIVEESFAAAKLQTDVEDEKEIEDEPNVMAFVGLIAGILIGIAVVFFLVVPSRETAIRDSFRAEEKDYSENLNIKLARIDALETELTNLKLNNTELAESLKEAEARVEYVTYENPAHADLFKKLYEATEAYVAYSVGKQVAQKTKTAEDTDLLFAAADALSDIEISLTADEEAIKFYNQMCDDVLSKAATEKYNEGRTSYDKKYYSGAIVEFLLAVKYNPKYDRALYYLAQSYDTLKEYTTALKYYNMLLENCPESTLANNAKKRVDALSGTN